jgi:hypothetical protein
MSRIGRILLTGLGFLLSAAAAKSAPAIHVINADAELNYPEKIVFTIEAESETPINVLELEFGLTSRDCTPDVNIIIPKGFSPSGHVDEEWTFSAGDIPPGMRIWWDWRLVDESGNELRTEKRWITWIDTEHDWKILKSGNILLHWYRGTEEFNQEYLLAAENARDLLKKDIDAWPSEDINLYIYGSNQEMKDALVGESDWVGGLSFFYNQRTIVIGIDPDKPDEVKWGKATIAHELAHTDINSIMGGCFAYPPLWVNEGIAMYAEGEQEPYYQQVLDDAIYYDSLFSLRSISYQYRVINGDPTLTYAQAYSVVKFMIDKYGNKKIRRFLDLLGEGYTHDNALMASIGVDVDGLEAAWRKSIGADPMLIKTPEASPIAKLEATLPPVSSSGILSTQTPIPPQTAGTPSSASSPGGIGQSSWGVVIVCFLSFLCVAGIGVVVIIFLWNRRKSNSSRGGQAS